MSFPMIFARRLKNGKWRLYEITDEALLAWSGPNSQAKVIRDVHGDIPTFETMEAAKSWTKNNHWEFDGEWPKCEMCGHYYRLAEDQHTAPGHCEEQRAREQRVGAAA